MLSKQDLDVLTRRVAEHKAAHISILTADLADLLAELQQLRLELISASGQLQDLKTEADPASLPGLSFQERRRQHESNNMSTLQPSPYG